jgi:5-methyltetrahydrofolate--homocysteine methyltransferase
MSQELIDAITHMKEEEALSLAKKMLDAGEDPMKLIENCRIGMEKVGELFNAGEYFLPELMLAGEMLSQISEIAKSKMTGSAGGDKNHIGKFLIGTVLGDIHDLGKNIVCFMMDINGFEVIDLGVNVPPETFVDAIKIHHPEIIGLSGLLTLAYEPMKQTVFAIEKAGQRENVKIMIGGGAMDEEIKIHVGADAYGKDAVTAVTIAKKWIG